MNRQSFIARLVKAFDPIIERPRWRGFSKALDRLNQDSTDLFFVQIGSNDGVIHDPLYKYVNRYRWRGILVEPVACYFDRLKYNYRNQKQLIFENVAISDKDEMREFFRIREGLEFLPAWSKGLGSFFPGVLLKHRWAIPGLENYIVTETVRCTSLDRLLKLHRVQNVDLLMIDTEGYDFEILKQVKFDLIKPRLIVFEHKHLDHESKKQCEILLKKHRYRLSRYFGNTMALLT